MRKRSIIDKRTPGQNAVLYLVAFGFAVYGVSLLYPMLWTVLNSLKTPNEFFKNLYGFPREWDFANYADAFTIKVNGTNLAGMFVNSVIVTFGGIALALFSCSLAAYTMSRYPFPGSKFLYSFMIVIGIIPLSGSMAAQYLLMKSLGLYNTHIGLILLYGGGFGYPFLLLYNFYSSVSWSYAESAMIDGAGDFTVFIRVMFPQSFPTLLAISIMSFMGLWGDFNNPYLYMNRHPTLTLGLKMLSDKMQSSGDYPAVFAAMLVTVIPVGVFYVFSNSKLYNAKIDTGIKG